MDAAQTAERIRAAHAATRAQRAEGLAYARAWRVRNKAKFDALYPQPPHSCRCTTCGQWVLASESVQ
ncbi:hypothetical protein S2M10_06950 [Sphingomonas sp. S2M10]|nr:hypothetical protein [Sphingomonas sp. S2M10]